MVIKSLTEWLKFQKIHNKVILNRNENDKKMPKEKYISPDERQKIINDLSLKY